MRNFYRRIKRVFLPIKDQIYAHEVISGVAELAELAETAFLHTDLINSIQKDIIILIVSNDFIAEPGLILTHFNRHYKFTIDEFALLSYRIGMTVSMYIEHPVYLLEDALALTDVFEEVTLIQFRELLDKQIVYDRSLVEQQYTTFFNQIIENKKTVKMKAADIDADRKIDEWLSKNKKNK
jgi:hypothetical protein